MRLASPKIVVVSYDVGLTCLGCAAVSMQTSAFELARERDRRPAFVDPWVFMTRHAVCDFAETVNLLHEGGSHAKSAKSVAATTYGDFFEHALLSRRDELLLLPVDSGAGAAARRRPPHLVVVESQKGLATSLVRQAYANFHRHLATFYNTLWRCGAQDVVPMLHKDSGAGKGVMARAVFEAEPRRFLAWMRRECDERDVLAWLAHEAHPRLELQDEVVDAAVRRFCAYHERDEMLDMFRKSPVLKAYAKARIAREGGARWLQAPVSGRTSIARAQQPTQAGHGRGQLAASLFDDGKAEDVGGADGNRDDGFLDYDSDLDVSSQGQAGAGEGADQPQTKKARVAFGGVRAAIAEAKNKARRGGGSRSKARAERREYNKVVVLCACETLFEVSRPSAPWFDAHWVALRDASRATERDKRRDMADAIFQGLFNLWVCISPKVARSPSTRRPPSVGQGSSPQSGVPLHGHGDD